MVISYIIENPITKTKLVGTMLIFQLYSYYIYIHIYMYIQGIYAYVITIAIHSPMLLFFFFAGQVGEASCSDHRPGCCRDVQRSRSCGALYWWHPHHHGAWGGVSPYVFHQLEGEKLAQVGNSSQQNGLEVGFTYFSWYRIGNHWPSNNLRDHHSTGQNPWEH